MDIPQRLRLKVKPWRELAFWALQKARERELSNDQFRRFFTEGFELSDEFFAGKRVLDVGCGPRGSLEWADMALERIGLDPLVGSYRKLGIGRHAMTYVESGAEEMPFPAGHFDVVSSLNSLDHVDDLDRAIAEITRVTRSGGALLLLTEVGHAATWTEPQEFAWDVLDRFTGWRVLWERRNKKLDDIYNSLDADLPAEEGSHGLLSARLERC